MRQAVRGDRSRAPAREAAAPSGARRRLLVADDDALLRSLVRELLASLEEPPDVVEAVDGAEAVQLGLQLRPDVALLDLAMPRLGGAEAATTLQLLRPEMSIALVSSDLRRLREDAGHLRVPLFDKLEIERAIAWAAGELGRVAAAA